MQKERNSLLLFPEFLPFSAIRALFRPQEGTGNLHVKEVNQRPHEKGGDNRSRSRNRGNLSQRIPRQHKEGTARHNTYEVSDDPDVLELAPVPFGRHDDSNRVIRRYPQIGSHVKGGTETDDDDPDYQTGNADRQGRIREDALQEGIAELGNVAQKKEVYEGGDSDSTPVRNQAEQEEHGINDDIEGAELNRNQRIQTAHQRLEGVDPQRRQLKDAHADRTDDDARERHGYPPPPRL